MKFWERLFRTFAKPYPESAIKYLHDLSIYAGREPDNLQESLGKLLIASLFVLLFSLAIPYAIVGKFMFTYVVGAIVLFIFSQAVFFLVYYFRSEDRTKEIEDALPDVLQLISANLKAGMTPFQSMKLAARDDFGAISEEIKRVTTRALGTESFENNLMLLAARVNSESFRRSMKLFSSSIRSGAKLAQLLDELALDISETMQLKRELVTTTKTYTAFIMFTVVIGTPLLLSISYNFIRIITDMNEKTSSTVGSGFGMSMLAGGVSLTPEFFFKICITLLILTPVLATMLIGVIKEGKPAYGLRYSLFLVIACIIIFFIFKHYISGFLGT